MAHNQPSGDPVQSPEDREITRRGLVDAGALLRFAISDSLAWTRSGAHVSIREESAELFVLRPGR